MGIYRLTALALLALRTVGVFAAASSESAAPKDAAAIPNLDVAVKVAFADAEVFGVKLINGRATKAVIDFTNNEPESVNIAVIGGALSSNAVAPEGTHPSALIVRNLTAQRFDVEVPAGKTQSLPYSFTNDLLPQDLRLNIIAVLSKKGVVYQVQAFNETVSVVDGSLSVFDPQVLLLYLFLLSAFTGTLYFVYKTWIESLFPQTKRGGKGGERAKKSTAGYKVAVAPKDQVSVIGADGPAVTTEALAQKAYDESWIPDHHINRPKAKRVQSGKKKE